MVWVVAFLVGWMIFLAKELKRTKERLRVEESRTRLWKELTLKYQAYLDEMGFVDPLVYSIKEETEK
jgi:hypothetical protein